MAILPNGLNLSQAFIGNSEVQSAWLGNTKIWEKQTPTERIYLYNYGDECTSITGGWVKDSSTGTFIKNSDNMLLSFNYSVGDYTIEVKPVNNIDWSLYTGKTLYINSKGTYHWNYNLRVNDSDYITGIDNSAPTTLSKTIDISNTSKLTLHGMYRLSPSSTCTIYAIWLE